MGIRTSSILMIAAATAGVLVLATDWRRASSPAWLEADPAALDFGVVTAQSDFRWSIPFTNQSAQTVKVDRIRTSCGCSTVSSESVVFAPGETKAVDLTLDLTGKKDFDASSRPFSVSLYLDSQVRKQSGHWVLKGQVEDLVQVEPAILNFGEVLNGSHSEPRIVSVYSKVPLEHLSPSSTDSTIRMTPSARTEEGCEWTFQATVTAPTSSFPYSEKLQFVGETVTGDPVEASCLVRYRSVGPLRCEPDSDFLGTVTLGSTLSVERRLRLRSGRPLQLRAAKPTSTDRNICQFSLIDDHRISIAVTPDRVGLHKVNVDVEWTSAAGSIQQTELSFRYITTPDRTAFASRR